MLASATAAGYNGGNPPGRDTEEPPMHATAAGAVAGFAATAPMSLAMVLLHRLLPPGQRYPLPPRQITDALVDEAADAGLAPDLPREQRRTATLVNHFAYGAGAGALYGALPIRPSPAGGVGYGLAVWTVSYLGLLPALGLLPRATHAPAPRNALMIAAHVVWGLSLGILAGRLAGAADGRR